MTIKFNDIIAVSLYNNEISGQLSDGIYENWRAGNRRWWGDVEFGETNDCGYAGWFNYNLTRIRRELNRYGLGDRMYAYIMSADLYCAHDCDNTIAIAAEYTVAFFDRAFESTKNYEKAVKEAIAKIESVIVGDSGFDFVQKAIRSTLDKTGMTAEQWITKLVPKENITERARKRIIRDGFARAEHCINECFSH